MTMGLLAVPGAADSFAVGAVRTDGGDRRRRIPAAEWLIAEALLVLVALAAAAATDHDFAAALARFAAGAAGHIRQAPWELTPVLLILAVLHYLAAAVSLRTAAGVPLSIRQTFKVQLAAAAANRVTPAGLGAAAVNARFLVRKGHRDGTQAISVISTLGILGAVADALVFVLVVAVGSWFGMHGAAHELGALIHKLTGPAAALWHALGWTGLGGIAAGSVLLTTGLRAWRRRRPDAAQRAAKISGFLRRLRRDFRVQLGELLRAPGRLAILLGCSVTTTITLGIGFLVTAQFAPHGTTIGAGGLVIAYLLGGMAGAVAPGPAGVGATEAALAGILISGGMPAAIALSSVMFFRLITFWVPALAGVWAVRGLRRDAAI